MTLLNKIVATVIMLSRRGTPYGNAYSVCFFLFNTIEAQIKSGINEREASLFCVGALNTITEEQAKQSLEKAIDNSTNHIGMWELLFNSAWTQHVNLVYPDLRDSDITFVMDAIDNFMSLFWRKTKLKEHFDKSLSRY